MIAASAFSASLGLASAMGASTVPRNELTAANLHNSVSSMSSVLSYVDGGTAALYGVIFDPAGAVIPSATLTITNSENNVVVMAYSGGTGQYKFSGLPPGTYNLKVEAPGFAPTDVPLITLRANDNNRLDQTLSIAQIQETVEIKSEATVVLGGAMIALPSNALVKAAQEDDIEAVKEALINIDANVRDPHTNSTALEHAVRNGNREMIQLLLWGKADVNARDRSGQTALMMLDEDVTTDIVWDLLNAGAKVNLRDIDGDTALSEIATVNNTEVMKTLLDAGAKVNAVNNQGQSALMKAAGEGLVNNIRVLVQAGAEINQQDKNGKTALIYAKEGEHRAAIRLLISLGAIELPEKEKEK
jgi:hypothetical protein